MTTNLLISTPSAEASGNTERFLEGSETMFEFVWAAKKKRMSKADTEALQQRVEEHRLEILREWEQKVAVDEKLILKSFLMARFSPRCRPRV